MKPRRRVPIDESWHIVTGNLPDTANWQDYVFGVPLFTVWWWITGVPESPEPPDATSEPDSP